MVYQETRDGNWRLRPGVEADHPKLDRIRTEGIASYRSFAPAGWEPPEPNPAVVAARMLDPDHWVTVAEDDSAEIVGYVAAGPAMSGWSEGEPIPGTAYLWQLFIDLAHHRRGIGHDLQKCAFDEMRRRGYRRALVRMASGAEQACVFYEATGWRVIDEIHDELMGMPTLVAERRL